MCVCALASASCSGSDSPGQIDSAPTIDSAPDASRVCGGNPPMNCGPDEYCDFLDNLCGAADGLGVCAPRPTTCSDVPEPACACDGSVYTNVCDAARAGSDIDQSNPCTPPSGQMFACGWQFCRIADQYCREDISDIGGEANVYTCISLPTACSNSPGCPCLANEDCGPLCTGDAQSGLTLTCPGG